MAKDRDEDAPEYPQGPWLYIFVPVAFERRGDSMHRTEAMSIPGGVLIRTCTTTETRGGAAHSEALTFVRGLRVTQNAGGTFLEYIVK